MEFPVVSAVTKAAMSDLSEPVLLTVNWATHIPDTHDSTETESLMTTADMCDHGIKVNGIHPNETKFGMTVEHQFLQFEWDEAGATVHFDITKPTEAELAECQIFELNSPLPPVDRKRRLPQQQWETSFKTKPMPELRKIFAYLPDDIISKTLDNTTQYYLETDTENRGNPQRHFRKRFKAILDDRQQEDVSTDFVCLSHKTSQNHKGGQFFVGTTSK